MQATSHRTRRACERGHDETSRHRRWCRPGHWNIYRARVRSRGVCSRALGQGLREAGEAACRDNGSGITAAPFVVDLADAAATLNAVEHVRTWAGGDPSSLVYNAFALQQGAADQLDLAESQSAMRVNFIEATQLTALLAPAMRASGTGSLLFTGGGAALHPYAGLSSLCAGKAALRMWVLTLAEELAGTGVRGKDREPTFILHARYFPEFRAFHSDPRFGTILREMDSPEAR